MCRKKRISGGESKATKWRAQKARRQANGGGIAGGSGGGRGCGDE